MKYIVTLNGKNYEVEVEKTEAVITSVSEATAPVAAPVPEAAPAAAPAPAASVPVAGGTNVTAPMPGTVLSISKNAGDSVNAGDVIMVLEAMKMENDIVAPCAGTIKQIVAQKGSIVETDAVLAVIG